MLGLKLHNEPYALEQTELNAFISRAACFLLWSCGLVLAVRHINYPNTNNTSKRPNIIKSMISDVENQ